MGGIDAPEVNAPRGQSWAAAAILVPAGALGLCTFAGENGLWIGLGLTAVLVVVALVFDGRPSRSGYLITAAVLLRLAALASARDGQGWTAPTQWVGLVASGLVVAAAASLLLE